jgi:NADH-ubiquinone oxidoreductase chain 4L
MVLILFVIVYFYLCLFNYELYFVMLFLVFSVCEGFLGLSILVSMIRGSGNDYFQSYRVLQC